MAIKKYPPKLNLQEAVAVIKLMNQEHKSREVSIDLMPAILATKRESSFFFDKINALKKFGFVEKMPNDILYLTDLAMQIIMPIGQEELEAKIQAFKKIDMLNDLLLKYPNGKLPPAEQLKQHLNKIYQAPKETLNQWYDFVLGSFRGIAELSEHSIYPQEERTVQTVVPQPSKKLHNLPLPSGGTFEFGLEDGYTVEDLDHLIGYFELLKKGRGGKK